MKLRHDSGFTLIELLVTVTIGAIIVALAVPSFGTLLQNSRLTAQQDAFVGALRYARSMALNQNTQAEVCPFSAAGSTACGGSWASGWIVVLNPNGSATSVPPLTLLQSTPVAAGGPVVETTGAVAPVLFDSRGLATSSAEFMVCDSRGSSYADSIWVWATGFVETGSVAGTAAWGGAITC
ncbi:type IV pre-pilin [Burkholderiales bacterium GJ-E10]|nr:type IV pre-pilin [Burkholderiales bacterium GJ-E10]